MPVLETAGFTAPPIIGGGTLILDPKTLEAKHEFFVPQDQLNSIKDILRKYPECRVLFNDYTEKEYVDGGWELQRLLDSDTCYMMEVVQLKPALADELIDKFRALQGVTSIKMRSVRPDVIDIQVVNEKSTKDHAVRLIQRELGISQENTIGIGDGQNDIDLFSAVGQKVAVGNAVKEIKDLADEVIGSVESDPVTEFLRGFVA